MEYSSLSRSEILELIKQQKAVILQTKFDMEPADNPQAQLIISELKTDLHELLTALQTTAHDRSHTLQQHTTNYELLLRQQSLRDATKSIRTFEPGSDVNRFITDLNKAYTIHVKCSTMGAGRQSRRVCFGAKPDKGFLDMKSRRIRKW